MIVVITGASSGIGLELYNKYLSMGNTVIGISRTNINNLPNFYLTDVSNELLVNKTFDEISKKFGNIDILICSAGYGISGATELIDEDTAKKMFEVNYFGVLNCVNNALKCMKEGAKIGIISSASAYLSVPFRTHYAASKAAVQMLGYGYKMELGDSKIEVCNFCPGEVKTNFTSSRIKVFETNFRYGDNIKKSVGKIDKNSSRRMSVEYVAKIIIKTLYKKALPASKIIGKKYAFIIKTSRIFPINLVLKLTKKFMI